MFRGEDSLVLMVIDKPITNLLEESGAPPGLTEFAGKQYGVKMTLMDLEPAIVISVIDAVRYRYATLFSNSDARQILTKCIQLYFDILESCKIMNWFLFKYSYNTELSLLNLKWALCIHEIFGNF